MMPQGGFSDDGKEENQGIEEDEVSEDEDGGIQPAADTLKDLKKKDAKALFFIQQAVDDAVFSSRISAATKAKEAWDALRNGYQGTTKVLTVKLQTLRRQFESFRMKDGESVHDCSNNLMVIVNQMRKYGEKITDQTVVEKLLRSLTRKYESTVAAIEESKDLTVMTIDELLGSLQSHEDRHKSYEENSTENAFQAKLKFTKETNGGHERSGNNYNRGGSSYRERYCRTKQHDEKQANFAEDEDETESLFLACYATNVFDSEVWYMDSGSSSHMTANSEVFISLDRSAKTRIKMADGTIRNTEGKGVIKLNSGEGSCIKDVLYVPELDSNLLSVGQFLREGYSLLFEDFSCTVFTDKTKKNLLLKVPMSRNNMFPLVISDENKALAASLEDENWLWHHRCGHLNFKSLSLLSNQNLVDGLPMIRHIDATPSLNNNRYFVVFIDDFSRMTWVCFLKEKSEVFSIFRKFKASVEKQSGNAIKVLRTDRGGEFVSAEFDSFCEEMGIHRQLTTSYTPQQNGVAERKNRSLVEMAKSMLKAKCVPKSFWAEATHTAARDVVFDEKSTWNGSELQMNEATIQDDNELTNQQTTEGNGTEDDGNSYPSTPESSPSSLSSQSASSSSSSTPPRKWRSLTEIYEQTERCQLVQIAEPSSFEEAARSKAWCDPMDIEMKALENNKMWELVNLPKGKEVIGLKWIYKLKFKPDGSIQKHKARLVARGYMQREAFLNGFLEEEVYVQQPKGYELKGEEMKVYKLRKALYGLKQTPRAWYERIDTHFKKNGFQRSASEATLYVKTKGAAEVLLICLYVDDLIYKGNSVALINNFKKIMVSEFEMTDLCEMSYFLGLEVQQSEDGIFISQHKYVKDLLEKYNMKECNAVGTPMIMNQKFCLDDGEEKVDAQLYRSLVGSLLYLTNSRPDILQATTLLSRFMKNPSNIHYGAANRVLRYLKGTRSFGLWYSNSNIIELLGFSYSDWAGSVNDRKSTTGYLFMLGSNAISWCSKKQPSTALSSSEAEYMAVSLAACQAIWLRRILGDMKQHQEKDTTILCDNQSTISMTKNPVHHNRTRHIDTRHHYIRELVNEGKHKDRAL
ncbi:UNVERIFIED_CONTAM: Retrovirus-related Pol polyprotein from transposon TNT 1-94 [Sesamum latifolium]|uniref:Retrovirus-related Pol polyprotein from transposon TNT 1-94 n=1 Tax=Sesamum latifolium TaxID=2727402 RepID=A0AAW2WAN2_9LAMI